MDNQNKKKKLSLSKETIRTLSSEELDLVHGGVAAGDQADFTYSLSLGDRCQKSNDMSGGGYTCQCAAN
jgi:hypothetical protein